MQNEPPHPPPIKHKKYTIAPYRVAWKYSFKFNKNINFLSKRSVIMYLAEQKNIRRSRYTYCVRGMDILYIYF